jgi:uncharacterized protein YuzE
MGLIVLDFDERRRLVGLEILEAKKNLCPGGGWLWPC